MYDGVSNISSIENTGIIGNGMYVTNGFVKAFKE